MVNSISVSMGQERVTTEEGMKDEGEERETTKWEKLVELVQLAFQYKVIADEADWKAVVLVLKWGGDYCGIGFVAVMWKAAEVIPNHRFTIAITYHNFLHRFQVGRGTGTATLEVKLLHQVAELREAVLHVIFLDLQKAYNASDRSRCLGILEGYGVGIRDLRLLRQYWVKLNMVVRAGGYYGAPLRGERGVTKGEPLSPTIFNVVVDAVICHWESLLVAEWYRG